MITKDFISRAPKTDLHVHLDGSIRIPTLIEIARQEGMELPSYTVEGLNELVFKEKYQSLGDYLTCFGYTCRAMQTPENLERVAYEFALDNLAEGVRYFEVRFAPQLHMGTMDLLTVLESVNRGLARARIEFNRRPEVVSGAEPEFKYGIIACAMRMFGPVSDYFRQFLDAHPFSKPDRIYALAAYELAQGVVKYRDLNGLPVVGFDLAGQEDGYPAHDYWKAYHFAHKNFMHKTVHAGEAYGPESIFQAITDLYAERIGHGYYLFDISKISSPEIEDREAYVRALAHYIADKRITIEVCLTSNLQTNPSIGDLGNHQFKNMRAAR
ncbi:MAG TPA: adenosine deaminase family protein, partial [bacterium]|nr:adenosine deaminase family protein [bacterium]